MATLLYHASQVEAGVSPFDEAIVQVARSGPVRIVSPYIGVAYLERIIGISKDWRLISDVQEWLASLSTLARPRAWQFIRENIELIHHYPALHAKAVISDSLAMMGSANLTQSGILGRTEMGILIGDAQLVPEMCAWFETLCGETPPPVADETSEFIKWLDEEASQRPARRQRFALSSSSRKVRARLVKLEGKLSTVPDERVPLDLSTVAQAIIVQDQKHYDSLEQALEAAIDLLTAKGDFTFGEIVGQVRKGFPGAVLREIYFLLVQHCANHVRSVFAETTQNRLIVTGGRFSQSSREAIGGALAPFDAFLLCLISHLKFHKAIGLPSEDQLEKETGVHGRDQVVLVSELLDCGCLRLEDVPGELPHYRLEEDFEWEGRYGLFRRSKLAWAVRKDAISSDSSSPSLDEGSADDPGDWAPHRADVPFPSWIHEEESLPSWSMLGREAARARAERNVEKARVEAERMQNLDLVLSFLLRKLLSGDSIEVENVRELASYLQAQTGIGHGLIIKLFEPRAKKDFIPIIVLMPLPGSYLKRVEINSQLSWVHLGNYPAAQTICKAALEG